MSTTSKPTAARPSATAVGSLRAKARSTLVWLLVAFFIAYALIVLIAYQVTRDAALGYASEQIEDALLTHRAMHLYIEEVQKPEIYRLKDEDRLYQEYFAPQILSFTYIAREVKDRLNLERKKAGLPSIYFKLASDNPRNPINAADARERELLRRMNEEGLTEYRELHTGEQGERMLYFALPIAANRESCMRCHGDPQDAPAELLARYGDVAGFHETPDRIRAMISIRVPLDEQLAEARSRFYGIAGVALAAFTAVYLLIAVFLRRLDDKNRQLERLSITDPLTGLHNRLKFTQDLEREIVMAGRSGQPLGLIMLDIDNFKQINDQLGHDVGDKVLKQFAARLRSGLRRSDLLARWGGEEFIVACPHTDMSGAAALAEKLRETIADGPFAAGLQVTASLGVTEWCNDDLRWLVNRADSALYQAKQAGRNQVVCLAPPRPGDVPPDSRQ